MALTEEQRNPWRAIVAGGDYNLTSQDWEDLLTELDSLYTEAPIAQPASAPSEQIPVAALKELGKRLAALLDEDDWAHIEPFLIECMPTLEPNYKAQRDALLELLKSYRDDVVFRVGSASPYRTVVQQFQDRIRAAIASAKGGA